MYDVIITGGGAAGLAAAIEAARHGERVLLLERMDRVGKKLLATGNGRCNLMNRGKPRYYGDASFAKAVLDCCPVHDIEKFWSDLGLKLREEEDGRVYPASGQAATVLDVLRFALERYDVRVMTNSQVKNARKTASGFQVFTETECFEASRLIVTAGGKAQPKLGSNGSGYALMSGFGHRVIQTRPALTQLETDTGSIRGLAGIRVRCPITLETDGRRVMRQNGEILFTEYGLSGICTMQVSGFAEPGRSSVLLHLGAGCGLENRAAIERELWARKERWRSDPVERLLSGLFVQRLNQSILDRTGMDWREKRCGELNGREITAVADGISGFRIRITGRRGFDSAQVTRGGISCEAFDPTDMSSKLVKRLHAAGEILDVDGDCGGFNLMFAFAGGILAGRNGGEP